MLNHRKTRRRSWVNRYLARYLAGLGIGLPQRGQRPGWPPSRPCWSTLWRRCGVWLWLGWLGVQLLAWNPVPFAPSVQAQTPPPAAIEADPPAEAGKDKTVNPVEDFQDGLETFLPPTLFNQIETAAVHFDGRTLFRVGAVVSPDPEAEPAFSARDRVRQIRLNLYQVAQLDYTPATLTVVVHTSEDTSDIPVILANQRYIMTVTAVDAQVGGSNLSVAAHAETLRAEIEQALQRYKEHRQLDYIARQSAVALLFLGFTVLGEFGLFGLERRLRRRRRSLKTLIQTPPDLTGPSTPESRANSEIWLQRQRQVTLLDVAIPSLWGVKAVLAIAMLYVILGVVPYLRWLQPALVALLPLPLKILAMMWVTSILLRLGSDLVNRFFVVIKERMMLAPEASRRISLRFSTFSKVITGLMAFIAWSAVLLIALAMIGIQLAPLLAGAGILGIGISLASQSLIKDVINGFFVLLEDQYGVGDVVVIGEVAGFVENLNLRITQLRNEEGRLITIPNSQITIVQNLSKEWSRVDLQVDVAHHSDLDRAIALIKDVADRMCQDPRWRSLILEPPLMLGVDRLDYRGATVRMWIKTQPLKQWDVAREYRRRLKYAFDEQGIAIGLPQQVVSLHDTRSDLDGVSSLDAAAMTANQTHAADSDAPVA